jgi:phosphotransferase system enzyme I (PtsI)
MLIKRGIAVSPGVAIGPAMVFGAESYRIPQQLISVNVVEVELTRFRAALEATCQEIQLNEQFFPPICYWPAIRN